MKRAQSIQEYYDNLLHWKEEILLLREIILSTGLEETIKWGAPCYTYNGKNVVGLADFKSYTGIWFFQGALLKDEKQYLVSGGESTHAMRQWRFYKMAEIKKAPIKSYLAESIRHFETGTKVVIEKKPVILPMLLEDALKKDKILKSHWERLSLSCRREYISYIDEAKKEETKISRLEKIKPMIIEKKSLHEKYKK